MKLTLPQIYLLNHAASVNSRRSDERAEWKKGKKDRAEKAKKLREVNDPIVEGTGGKRLSECTSEEIASQFRGM
jgi:hypothetical protein